MKKLTSTYILSIIAFILVSSCSGGKRNIPLPDHFWGEHKQKIIVSSFKAPTPQLYQVGSQGLLDFAINRAVNKEFNQHLKNTNLDWYKILHNDFLKKINKHNMIGVAEHNQSFEANTKSRNILLQQAANNKLLLIELRAIGANREYYSVIPKGAPTGYCHLIGELIDPKDKKIWWRHEAEIIEQVQGPWDQPPNYLNVNQAINNAVNVAKQELLDSFFSGK